MKEWYLLSITVAGSIFGFANVLRNIKSKGFYREIHSPFWSIWVIGSSIPLIQPSLIGVYEGNFEQVWIVGIFILAIDIAIVWFLIYSERNNKRYIIYCESEEYLITSIEEILERHNIVFVKDRLDAETIEISIGDTKAKIRVREALISKIRFTLDIIKYRKFLKLEQITKELEDKIIGWKAYKRILLITGEIVGMLILAAMAFVFYRELQESNGNLWTIL